LAQAPLAVRYWTATRHPEISPAVVVVVVVVVAVDVVVVVVVVAVVIVAVAILVVAVVVAVVAANNVAVAVEVACGRAHTRTSSRAEPHQVFSEQENTTCVFTAAAVKSTVRYTQPALVLVTKTSKSGPNA
jgi:hypothetical protein